MLDMDGPLWECDVIRLNCSQLYNLVDELKIPFNQQPHFKAAHTMNGRLVVASNTFDENDLIGYEQFNTLLTATGTKGKKTQCGRLCSTVHGSLQTVMRMQSVISGLMPFYLCLGSFHNYNLYVLLE